MTDERITERFENGYVHGLVTDTETKNLTWNEHSLFKGVYLKHLIKGEETNGSLSCHLVRINPGCTIDTHTHNGKIEIHEILEGNGFCIIGESKIIYKPGVIALIPSDIPHKVTAGSDGIFILANFSPALL